MKSLIIFIVAIGTVLCPSSIAQKLNPGDGIRLTLFNVTDQISGDYFIQLDRTLQLPYIGTIYTNDKNYLLIKNEIIQKYDSLYRDPELSIQPLFKINIIGEVKQPGFYFVTDVEKLSGIFALAGGVTGDADIDNVFIIRDSSEIELDARDMIESGNTMGDVGLISGDRIYVPRTWWADAKGVTIIAGALTVIVSVAALLIK